MRKTTSPRQRAANRANAAKSTGPVTPEGKAAAALNALKHGLTARDVVLTTESCDQFDELRDAYYRRLKPVDYMESDLVDDLVVVRWEIRRMRCICHSHFELEIQRPNPDPALKSFTRTSTPRSPIDCLSIIQTSCRSPIASLPDSAASISASSPPSLNSARTSPHR